MPCMGFDNGWTYVDLFVVKSNSAVKGNTLFYIMKIGLTKQVFTEVYMLRLSKMQKGCLNLQRQPFYLKKANIYIMACAFSMTVSSCWLISRPSASCPSVTRSGEMKLVSL